MCVLNMLAGFRAEAICASDQSEATINLFKEGNIMDKKQPTQKSNTTSTQKKEQKPTQTTPNRTSTTTKKNQF